MEWILTTLTWYFYLFILGLIFFPLIYKFFGEFFDKGYAMSKTIAIIAITYFSFVLGILHLVPFTRLSLFIIIGLIAAIELYIFRNPLKQLVSQHRNAPIKEHKKHKNIKSQAIKLDYNLVLICFLEEILFLAGLFFLTYVRGQEPSIHGLEKFMDFGFMNSILKSVYFPPLDMWLSADATKPMGYPINYYYFGHLSGALLIKLTGISPYIGYNLILATILAQGSAMVFSLVTTLCLVYQKYVHKSTYINYPYIIAVGLIGSFIVNLGGNLHTIYLFTNGYPNDAPVPFWKILSGFNPSKYWYPNATRFIPYTIHEFPSYSYVVADLHGHVFDIPFVLVTFGVLFKLFINLRIQAHNLQKEAITRSFDLVQSTTRYVSENKIHVVMSVILGFMCAIHYMTNAFDGPIYMLLALIFFLIIYRISLPLIVNSIVLITTFVIASLPFSSSFSPFVSGVGVNCSPDFLVKIQKFGPFLFEKGNCQISPLWMLFVLWGFFLIGLLLLISTILLQIKSQKNKASLIVSLTNFLRYNPDYFILIIFIFGFFLITIPEFFYIKDIYPAHFRANTMFKLGYQAFIIMGIASAYTLYRTAFLTSISRYIIKIIFLLSFILISLYPFFSFPSYYGDLKKTPQLDGSTWLQDTYPADKEIITYINKNIKGQPVILEGQGDSYTDYERISAYTGMPTVAGWLVHEWLWRGSADVVGKRAPDISTIYETEDGNIARQLLAKYQVKYVVVSRLERDKYKNLQEKKFEQIGKKIFESSDKLGALYQVE